MYVTEYTSFPLNPQMQVLQHHRRAAAAPPGRFQQLCRRPGILHSLHHDAEPPHHPSRPPYPAQDSPEASSGLYTGRGQVLQQSGLYDSLDDRGEEERNEIRELHPEVSAGFSSPTPPPGRVMASATTPWHSSRSCARNICRRCQSVISSCKKDRGM